MASPPRILFVCEGNRARSQLAEALMRFHAAGRFEAYSAGVRPGDVVPDFTLDELRSIGVPADGLTPNHYSDFADQEFDWVITVCDKVFAEAPPLPPAKHRLHWSIEDPGDMQKRMPLPEAIRQNRIEIRERVVRFLEEQGCIFCQILAGEAEASFVYRDADVAAFMDLRPVTEGHTLVIPTAHHVTMDEVPEPIAGKMMAVAGRIAKALPDAVRMDGYNLWVANGEVAGQEVFHVHLHILPRYRGDGFGLRFPAGYGKLADRPALDALAKRLASTDAP